MQYNKYKLMSYTVSLFHIVIGTHQRKMSINEKHKTELYKYIWGIIEKCNCKLFVLMAFLTIYIYWLTSTLLLVLLNS